MDPKLKAELVIQGLNFSTSMEFIAKDDILLLEKNTGNVKRVTNGNVSGTLLHLDVAKEDEQGLLGLGLLKSGDSTNEDTLVFLYYTQCENDHLNLTSHDCGNFVYRYKFELKNSRLSDPRLILRLPAMPGPAHNGGALEFDKDKHLFITIGDLKPTLFNENLSAFDTKIQNFINGTSPDGRAGILRVTQDGNAVGQGILGGKYPLNLYYAYGIRNSFGIGFDPLTGNLWDTENGPHNGDEINLVKPGFNSGWEKVQGVWQINKTREKDGRFSQTDNEIKFVSFNSNGKYSRPEFVWDTTVGPTALTFLNSDKLGKEYENDIFVGSTKKGIFHFDLSANRESLSLPGNDYVLNENENPSKLIFGENFGTITDLEVGPDGFLYVLSGFRTADEGSIYRITPK